MQGWFGLSFEATVALVAFAAMAAATLGAIFSYHHLPEHHLDDRTIDIVRIVAGIFGLLSSLVLGLMVSSASTDFSDVEKAIRGYATELIMLDRALRDLGPEGEPARAALAAYVANVVAMRDVERPALPAENISAEATLHDIGARLSAMPAADPQMIAAREAAKAEVATLMRARWAIIDRTEGSVPFPLIVALVLWLSLSMACYGYRAPKNAVAIGALLVSSALLSGAIYLIIDLGKPFDGPIQASSDPFTRALGEISRLERFIAIRNRDGFRFG